MYAVVDVNGSQVIAEKNAKIVVNRLNGLEDKKFTADKVLFGKKGNSYYVGEPYVKGAFVEFQVLGETRGKKVIAFKYRDRKSSQSKIGHRQDLTELKVVDINFGEKEKKKDSADKKDKK